VEDEGDGEDYEGDDPLRTKHLVGFMTPERVRVRVRVTGG